MFNFVQSFIILKIKFSEVSSMAAIIAQITRANRERKRKKTYEIQKCMYDLPPFDPHFDPLVHNKYLAR